MRSAPVPIAVIAIACGGGPRPPTSPPPASAMPRELAVAEPFKAPPSLPPREPDGFVLRAAGERIIRIVDPGAVRRGGESELESVAESDLWDPCVRNFVRGQSPAARRALTIAFSRFVTRCDGSEFVVTPPYERRDRSHLSLEGRFVPLQNRHELSVRFASCGSAEPYEPTGVVMIGDGVRWLAPQPVFERQRGCDVALIVITPSVARALRDMIGAAETVIRFEAAPLADDVIVSDEMKQDVRAMLDALDSLAEP